MDKLIKEFFEEVDLFYSIEGIDEQRKGFSVNHHYCRMLEELGELHTKLILLCDQDISGKEQEDRIKALKKKCTQIATLLFLIYDFNFIPEDKF